jgi:hypothetical protein
MADPRIIKGALFPVDDSTSIEAIAGALSELSVNGHVQLYEIGDERYGIIHKFKNHQVINRPSKSRIPKFSESSVSIHGVLTDGSGSGSGKGKGSTPLPPSPSAGGFDAKKYALIWSDRFGAESEFAFGQNVKFLKTLQDKYGEEETLARWKKYLFSRQDATFAHYANASRFSSMFNSFAKEERRFVP